MRAVHGLALGDLVMLLGLVRLVWLLGGGRWAGDRLLGRLFVGLADLMALFGLLRLLFAPPAGYAWFHPLLMVAGLGLLHAGQGRWAAGASRPGAWLLVGGYFLLAAGYVLILRLEGAA